MEREVHLSTPIATRMVNAAPGAHGTLSPVPMIAHPAPSSRTSSMRWWRSYAPAILLTRWDPPGRVGRASVRGRNRVSAVISAAGRSRGVVLAGVPARRTCSLEPPGSTNKITFP